MEALTGQLLAPAAPQLHTSTTWVDALTGEYVRVELRETTLTPETETERVHRAAADAQRRWAAGQRIYSQTAATPQEAARVFGERYGGTWRPFDPGSW